MASIVLTAVGNALLPGVGGALLGAVGNYVGGLIDQKIFGVGRARVEGPRLENLKVQDSRYGAGIPLVYGRVRIAGNVIWASDLIETRHEESAGGGKGGGTGSSAVTTVRYSYGVNCAIALCEGPVAGVSAVWADGKLIYDGGSWKPGLVGGATFYPGTATQSVDPVMEGALGVGNVPAYRGMAYLVLEGLQLADFGNRLPNLTFEVLAGDGGAHPFWSGAAEPALRARVSPLRSVNGAPPLVIEGDSARVRRVIVGGYKNPGASCQFEIVEYDVSGDAPVEAARTSSASFASWAGIYDHSWALSRDGRYVVMQLQDDLSPTTNCYLVLYDALARQFGAVTGVSVNNGPKSLAWIDDLHCVMDDISGGRRGLRVLARAGLNLVDLGFFDVWGAGSSAARYPVGYAQFSPVSGGVLVYAGNVGVHPTSLYVCAAWWQNNGLVVGAPYTLTSSVPSLSIQYSNLLAMGDGEYLWCFGRGSDVLLMTFRPGVSSAIVTRDWQTVTPGGSGTTNAPVLMGGRLAVLQNYGIESVYRLAEIEIRASDFVLISPGVEVAGWDMALQFFLPVRLDHARFLVQTGNVYSDTMDNVGVVYRHGAVTDVARVADDLLGRAGYSSGEIDVGALGDVALDGYVVQEPMSARAALEPLRLYAPFDVIESGESLRAVLRHAAADVSVAAGELRAAREGEEMPPAMEVTRAQELDLPREVNVDYVDPARDFEVGSQRARRSVTRASAVEKISLPVVCAAGRAKRVAESHLYQLWAERERVKMRWSRNLLAVEPGDVVGIDGDNIRVATVRQSGGLIEVEGYRVQDEMMLDSVGADGGDAAARRAVAVMDSTLCLMDLPPLRREDDQPGVYAAMGGGAGWPGGSLWRSADGVSFSALSGFAAAAAMGVAATVLADGVAFYMDRVSIVRVQMLQGNLASCSEAELLNGANVAVLGDEVIQFQTASLIGNGLYELSNLLRGRRGTEDATAAHGVGERFVVLSASTVQFLPAQLVDRGREYRFRGLTSGQSLGDVADGVFTYGLRALQPLAPVHVTGVRGSGVGGDLTIGWVRRARLDAEWVDGIDVPLDEDAEIYDVEVMNGAVVVRSFPGVSATSQVYTAAVQSADWGTVPSSLTVRVYQVSARYGRGAAAVAVV